MFSLGNLNVGAASFRQFATIIEIKYQMTDPTLNIAMLYLGIILEASLATVFVCIPPLAPYFSRFLDRVGLTTGRSSASRPARKPAVTFGGGGGGRKSADNSLFAETQADTLKDTETTVTTKHSSTSKSDWQGKTQNSTLDGTEDSFGKTEGGICITQQHVVEEGEHVTEKRSDGIV